MLLFTKSQLKLQAVQGGLKRKQYNTIQYNTKHIDTRSLTIAAK